MKNQLPMKNITKFQKKFYFPTWIKHFANPNFPQIIAVNIHPECIINKLRIK